MSGVLKAGPAVPGWLAGTIVGLALGGVLGFYGQEWLGRPGLAAGPPPGGGMMGGAPGGGGGPGGGGPGMMGGGGGGGGGAQDHPNAAQLVRTVSALATLDAARGKDLSAEQRAALAKVAGGLKSDATLTEEQCAKHLEELQAVLTDDQKALLETMTFRGGGRGPGGGMGGPGGGMSGPGGRMGGPGGGMGGPGGNRPGGGPGLNGPAPAPPTAVSFGGGTNYERPFAEGRPRERLEALLESLER